MTSEQMREAITGEMTIGQVFTQFPESKSVIEKYFHGGCHHCPSQHTEPLWLAAKLYAIPIDQLLTEIRASVSLTCSDLYETPASFPAVVSQTPTERRLARDRARGLIY